MSAIISSSNYPIGSGSNGGTVDQKVVLSNSSLARTMYIGNDWKSIRMGLRLAFAGDSGGDLTTPINFFGLCSGTSSIYGDSFAKHAVGLEFKRDWTRTAAPSYNPQVPGDMDMILALSGSADVHSAGAGGGVVSVYFYATASARNILFVDFTKQQSPTGSVISCPQFFHNTVNAASDVLDSTFYTQLPQAIPTVPNHQMESLNLSLTTKESSGTLDTINITWGQTVPQMEIYDLAVYRFS